MRRQTEILHHVKYGENGRLVSMMVERGMISTRGETEPLESRIRDCVCKGLLHTVSKDVAELMNQLKRFLA